MVGHPAFEGGSYVLIVLSVWGCQEETSMSLPHKISVVHHQSLWISFWVRNRNVIIHILTHHIHHELADARGSQWLEQEVLEEPVLDDDILKDEFFRKFEQMLLEELLMCHSLVVLKPEVAVESIQLKRKVLRQFELCALVVESGPLVEGSQVLVHDSASQISLVLRHVKKVYQHEPHLFLHHKAVLKHHKALFLLLLVQLCNSFQVRELGQEFCANIVNVGLAVVVLLKHGHIHLQLIQHILGGELGDSLLDPKMLVGLHKCHDLVEVLVAESQRDKDVLDAKKLCKDRAELGVKHCFESELFLEVKVEQKSFNVFLRKI